MNDPTFHTIPLAWREIRRLPGLEGRIDLPNRGAVVLSTVGSLGDLYPVLAIARALELTGLEARLALTPDDCEVARAWGLLATPVGPSQSEVCRRLGVTRDDIAASILRDPGPMLRDVLTPMLPTLAAEMAPLMQGASAVAATPFALAAPMAAEQAGLPFVPLLLQPMMTFSTTDPPRAGPFRAMRPTPGPVGRVWNRAIAAAARGVLSRRHRTALDTVRTRLGLPPHRGTPLIDPGGPEAMRLGLWDARFSAPPADAPEGLRVVGFPPAPDGDLPPEATRWIEAGPPPLVVTLGSIAQSLAGPRFWHEAVALARVMGLRAVLLHGDAKVPAGPDLLPLRYAAHAALFPQAAAILHHGGIGTTAEALRAGRPQLVIPVGGDQPDNAARLVRLGLAATLPPKRFTADRARVALAPLLERFDYVAAQDLGDGIARTNGAGEAALHLARIALASR